MSTPEKNITNSDFIRAGGGFSFTGKIAELARNQEWVDGFKAISDGTADRNQYSFLWEAISSGAETTGNEFYTQIRNYVDNIGNIDTCDLNALKNYSKMLCIDDDTININFEFPKEIKELIEIFSVNTAYLFNKSTDGTSLLALQNSILHTTTIEKLLDALKDRTKYKNLVRETFYNTLMKFLNLTVGEFSSEYSEINASDLIWKLNISKFTDSLWDDDVASETDIYTLKRQLGVAKSFTEKLYVDDIIAGKRKLTDFTDSEQTILKEEIKSRQTRYSKDTSMKYYFMRLYKVIEYFRFTTIAYRNSYNLSDYDISTSKFVISDKTTDSDSILKATNGVYAIDKILVMKVAEWLSDYSFELSNIRDRMKTKCQKNMMSGTKKLIIDTIREYLLEKIDSEAWRNFRNTTLFNSNLNKNFEVSLVEYLDPTEYFNVENPTDVVNKNTNRLNPRYWEQGYDDNGSFDKDEVRNFYNRLTESRATFIKNSQSESGSEEPNLYDFLSNLFEMGAVTNTVNDIGATTTEYIASESTQVAADSSSALGEKETDALRKFSGDEELGYAPYANEKNVYHPSFQIHPFINAFEEYNYAYSGIMNLVNSFSVDLDESRRRLKMRIDDIGNTINFWLNWNEDFTGYSTNFEKGGNDNDSKFNQDSPFNFDALNEYLKSDMFISNLLTRTNEYYIDDSTGKFILTDDEVDMEIQRLKKFKSEISELAGKEIYRYGKDIYGNSYMLYKDEGKRKDKDALGEMWVRLKNHPIAFPLFDFDKSQNSFSKVSCISDTDNAKLLSLISNILIKFENSYGVNYASDVNENGLDSSRVEVKNLTLTVMSHQVSGLNEIDENGNPKPLDISLNTSDYHVDEILTFSSTVQREDSGYTIVSSVDFAARHTDEFKDSFTIIASVDNDKGTVTWLRDSEQFSLSAYGIEVRKTVDTAKIQNDDKVSISASHTVRDHYTFVKKPTDAIINYFKTEGQPPTSFNYYIDMVTNEIVPEGTTISSFVGDVKTTSTAESKPLSTDISDCFYATFVNGKCSIELNEGDSFYFARFEDNSDTDPDTAFKYRYDEKQEIDHACAKHTMVIRDIYTIKETSLNGEYDINGNVMIRDFGTRSEPPESGWTSLSAVGIKQSVDGGLIYEDVSGYKFEFREPESVPECVRGVLSSNMIYVDGKNVESNGYVITAGGRNNFFYALPTFKSVASESDNIENVQPTLEHLDIYPLKRIDDGARAIVFSSDKYYRNPFPSPSSDYVNGYTSSVVYYDKDEVRFSSASGGEHGDTIAQFSPIGIDKYVFSPYTTITDVVTSEDELDELCKTEQFSSYTGDVQSIIIEGHTCFYRLSSNVISGIIVDSEVMSSSVEVNTSKLHGGFDLYSSRYDETPISLRFYDIDGIGNLLTYTSKYTSNNQKKFYDFGFSNDQRMLFLNFADGMIGFENGGTIIGKIGKVEDEDGSNSMSFLRESMKNMEFMLPSYCGKDYHLGDATNKKAVFSVFGTYEHPTENGSEAKFISISMFVFTGSNVLTYNFRTKIEFAPYDFIKRGESSQRYSFKCVATDSRLFIAFTSETPSNDDIVSNTVNGVTAGSVGSAEFKNISKYCGDSMITILSFNIEELDNISYEDSETRYVMQNGALGYFPQYSGLIGKNLMFTNPQLSADERYPFYAQFDTVDTENGVFKLIDNYHVSPVNNDNYGKFTVRRFIDTYDEKDAVRGFAFPNETHNAIYHVNLPLGGEKNVVGLTKIDLPNDAYDISRFTSDSSNLMHILAEGIDRAGSATAVRCDGLCKTVEVTRVPIWSEMVGDIRTDFIELFDMSKDSMIAFHADGRTVSELRVDARDDEDGIFYKGIFAFDSKKCTETFGTSGFETFCTNGRSRNASFIRTDENSVKLVYANSEGDLIDNTINGNIGAVFPFFIDNNGFEYPCAFYQIDRENEREFWFSRFNAVDGHHEEMIEDENGLKTTIIVADFTSDSFTVPVELDNTTFDNDDITYNRIDISSASGISKSSTRGNIEYFALGINSPDDEIDDTDSDGHIATFKHTKDAIANMVLMLGIDTTIDNRKGKTKWSAKLNCYGSTTTDLVRMSDSETTSSFVSENEYYNLISLNSDSMYGSIGYLDKNIAFSGSTAERSTTYDYDGESEYEPSSVGRIYSIDNISVCDADERTSVLVSTDYGKTFRRVLECNGLALSIIGTANGMFYAISNNNGSVLESYDGVRWRRNKNLGNSMWAVASTLNGGYAACSIENEAAGMIDKTYYINILKQSIASTDDTFDEFFVSKDGRVVMVGGIDGKTQLRVALGKIGEKFEIGRFEQANGREYSSSFLFDNHIFLAPVNSTNVLRIGFENGIFTSDFIDISDAICNEAISYRGFEEVNGSLVMYPSDGRRMLVYNTAGNSFFNYYTSEIPMLIADTDKLGAEPNNELLLTMEESDGDGSLNFAKTNFTGRNDYGIVEIDNGFPIQVTYEKVETVLPTGADTNRTVSVYQFTFKFLNSANGNSVSIITTPNGDIPSEFKSKFADSVSKSKNYLVGNESITYTFSTVDSTPKYCIYRNFLTEKEDYIDEFFNISYTFNSKRRGNSVISYSTPSNATSAFVSVYDGFDGFTMDDKDNFENIVVLSPSVEEQSEVIQPFTKFAFTNTAEFSGQYTNLSPSEIIRKYVDSSNFMFMSPNTTFYTFSNMFRGCENAGFNSTLYIEERKQNLKRKDTNKAQLYPQGTLENPTDAEAMFKNCHAATIPSADIGDSTIENMHEMFYECNNAILEGLVLPKNATDISDAFRNCSVCKFEEISSISTTVTSMSGAFYGCANGSFSNFTFDNLNDE